MTGAVLRVPDEDLPIVLDPALATQDVVNAGRHLVPLKVVPKPEGDGARGGSGLALSRRPGPLRAGHMGLCRKPWGPGSDSAMKRDLLTKQSSRPRKHSVNTH